MLVSRLPFVSGVSGNPKVSPTPPTVLEEAFKLELVVSLDDREWLIFRFCSENCRRTKLTHGSISVVVVGNACRALVSPL